MTNSAHDMGVVSEGEWEIARRNLGVQFSPSNSSDLLHTFYNNTGLYIPGPIMYKSWKFSDF